MLIGEYRAKLGLKNRTAFPKALRQELGEELIITRGYEGCLIIVDKAKWSKLIKLVEIRPLTNLDVRNTKRFLIGGASEIQLDSQARFVIPESLIKYAHLENEIMFVGILDWIELWDNGTWEKRIDQITKESADIADRLSNIAS